MGRFYTAPFHGISVTTDADQDIIELVNGSSTVAILHEIQLSSTYTTDERASLRLVRRSTTGSGGTGITEVKVGGAADASPAVAASYLVTTPGTIGDIILAWQWSQLAPFVYLPTPEMRIVIPPSGRLCLNLNAALASSRTWSGWAIWEELG